MFYVCLLLLCLHGARAWEFREARHPCASEDTCCQFIHGNASWSHVPDKCECALRKELDNIIPYTRWHYCNLSCVPALSVFFCACWVLFLFMLIASTAEEYMVPNLERLSDMLKLSPNVAGVTLLALGNGGPDFFTSFNAYKTSARSAIGIGSLLGGGIFITSFVLGSVAIISPFTTNRRPLVRDLCFYIVSVCTIGYTTAKGNINSVEAVALVSIYAVRAICVSPLAAIGCVGMAGGSPLLEVYVVVVIGGRMVFQKCLKLRGLPIPPAASLRLPLRRQSLVFDEDFAGRMNLHRAMMPKPRSQAMRHRVGRSGVVHAFLRIREEAAAAPTHSSGAPMRPNDESVLGYAWAWKESTRHLCTEGGGAPSSDRFSALDHPCCEAEASLDHASGRALGRGGASAGVPADGLAEPRPHDPLAADRSAVTWRAHATDSVVSSLRDYGAQAGQAPLLAGPSCSSHLARSDGIACVSGSVQPPGVVRSKSWSISARWGELQQEMRPLMVAASVPRILIQLQEASGWDEKSTLRRLAYPLECAFVVARDLTIPLLDEPRWRRQICGLSLLGAPQLVVFKFSHPSKIAAGGMPLALLVFLISLPIALAVYTQLGPTPPTSRPLSIFLLSIAFAASAIWTDILANELVAGLDFLGNALGISKSVLGLTVLAWGNSIGDFVADTALARAGNPRMGAAGCIGGPLFNLLIGTGVSMAYHTITVEPLCFHFDKTVPLGLVFLIGSLLITAVAVPLLRWRLTRGFGILQVCYYSAFVLITVVLEITDPPILNAKLARIYGTVCPHK